MGSSQSAEWATVDMESGGEALMLFTGPSRVPEGEREKETFYWRTLFSSFTQLAQKNKGQLDILMLRLSQRLQSNNLETRNMVGLILETVSILQGFVDGVKESENVAVSHSEHRATSPAHAGAEERKETAKVVSNAKGTVTVLSESTKANDSAMEAENVTEMQSEEREDRVRMAAVGLFLCRSFTAAIIRYTHEEKALHLHFTCHSGETVVEKLLASLVEFLTRVDVNSTTYPLHREVENVLIVLLSTQLFDSPQLQRSHLFYDQMVANDSLLPGAWRVSLVQQLLSRFLDARDTPLPLGKRPLRRGFLNTLGSAASTVLWVPYSMLFSEGTAGGTLSLSQRSCLLLLLLCHKQKSSREAVNGFLRSLRACEDSSSPQSEDIARVPFPKLFNEICASLEEGYSIGTVLLLLFNLLQTGSIFKAYLLSRTDVTTMVVSLLRVLHSVVSQHSAHACDIMSLIASILLILSEDHGFHVACQRERLSAVSWHYDQVTSDVSVSDLLCAVVLKAAHANLAKFRSRGLQTLLLAVLANHAPFFRGLEAHTAYRLVALHEVVARRYAKARVACASAGTSVTPELVDLEEMYAEILHLSLHVLDLAIAFALQWNPHLVYALLYSRETFLQLHREPQLCKEVGNIVHVIEFFDAELSRANLEEFSSAAVTAVIEEALILRWERGRMRVKNHAERSCEERREVDNDMYIFEESLLEAFFLPYVWDIVVKRGKKIGGWSSSLLYPLFEGQEEPFGAVGSSQQRTMGGKTTSRKRSTSGNSRQVTDLLQYRIVSPPRGSPPGVYPPSTKVIDV